LSRAGTLAAMKTASRAPRGGERVPDADSRAWPEDLRAGGIRQERRTAELHGLLLRAARFEAHRRAAAMPGLRPGELDEITSESAADALVSVLSRLDDFRGESRFTTWAFKFAILETSVKLRRRAWQSRELPHPPETWETLRDLRPSPEMEAEQAELLEMVRSAMTNELTSHQREVLVAVALQDVPIDVLAERLGTTRGALYKTVHDARRRLRETLAAAGQELPASAREKAG
jgi:RNA polymerase sigma-70 factor (ECF subfamily)